MADTMPVCRFCGLCQEESDLRRVKAKDTLLLLLCIMVEKEELSLSDAHGVYNECVRLRKRICRRHYSEAATYIGDAVSTICKVVVSDLFTVPSRAIEEILVRLEPNRLAIDASFKLTANNVACFYRDLREASQSKFSGSRKRKSSLHIDDDEIQEELEGTRAHAEDVELASVEETEDRILSQRSEELNTSRTSEGVQTQQSQSTDPLSQYTNPSDSTIDSQDIVELDETDPVLLDRHFLIKGSQLLKLFRFCPSCGSKISESKRCVRLRAVGTAPVVDYICTTCYPFEKRFEGQERAVPHPKEKSFRGNVQAVVAAITTGTRYVELQRWAEEADIALFSKSFFYKIFSVAAPCIEREYMWHQQTVLSTIREEYRKRGSGLHIAADGSYDSRGYSAEIGKVVVADQCTKLIMHSEVLDRSQCDNHSPRMEIEGLRRALHWLIMQGLEIASLTTDRSRSFGCVLDEVERVHGTAIEHYFDGWHLVKWLGNELRKESRRSECGAIGGWIEKVKTHLWKCIERGSSGKDIKHRFNGCLMHVRDVHQWEENVHTGCLTSCLHGALTSPRPEPLPLGSKAYSAFRDVILRARFQEDLEKVGSHGGTSICETKNALDRLYCRKEVFYPLETYKLYIMLSTLHFNTLRLAERNGSRTVARVIRVKRKFLARQSTVVIKTPVKHERRSILHRVLDLRMEMLQKGSKGILDPAEVPLHIQQLAEVEDSAADLQAQVMRVEGLRGGLIEGLELDMMEDPEYTDDNRLLQIAYNIVNYNTNTGDPDTQ